MEKNTTFAIQILKQRSYTAIISISNQTYFNNAKTSKQVCAAITVGNIPASRKLHFIIIILMELTFSFNYFQRIRCLLISL